MLSKLYTRLVGWIYDHHPRLLPVLGVLDWVVANFLHLDKLVSRWFGLVKPEPVVTVEEKTVAWEDIPADVRRRMREKEGRNAVAP